MAERSDDIGHDQLFKDLLRAFFAEFMQLFFEDVAARLDLTEITFLDKETFTDLPQGSLRETDLVAEVHAIEGQPEIILVHIEVEARHRGDFPARMFEYYLMLKLRHRLPIYPIVIYLSGGSGGLSIERHEERVFEELINTFTYRTVGLPDLSADEYLARESPLAPALGALMKPSRLGPVAQKYESLRKLAVARLDDARRAVLTNIVETYLALDPAEQSEFERLLAEPAAAEVREMISIYEQRGIEQGIERGIEQGIERGIEQGIERGIEQGIAIGERRTLLRLLQLKFGDLPEAVRARIEALTDTAELDRLSDRILHASSLAEMGLGEA